MTQAQLTVRLPEGTWIRDVSTSFPDTQFRVLAAMPGDGAGFGLVEIAGSALQEVLRAMNDHDALTAVDLLQGSDRQILVQFETTRPLLLFSARESRVPIELPVEIADGRATVEVTASRDRLSVLSSQLDAFGLDFDVQHVRPRAESEQVLTARQWELITEAVDRGYYDTPRRCTVTELAEAVGIAKSTCSETLHRAEERIIKKFMETATDRRPEATDAFPQK